MKVPGATKHRNCLFLKIKAKEQLKNFLEVLNEEGTGIGKGVFGMNCFFFRILFFVELHFLNQNDSCRIFKNFFMKDLGKGTKKRPEIKV